MKQHLSVILGGLIWGGARSAGRSRFEGEGHASTRCGPPTAGIWPTR